MTFKTYPKIKSLGHEENSDIFTNPEDAIVIEEKIDGANFRFMIEDGKLRFGSRTQELYENGEHMYQKAFDRAIKFVMKTVTEKIQSSQNDAEFHEFDGLIFYGENCIKHTLDYQWDVIPPFLGFDIFDLKEERFLSYAEKTSIFEKLNLPVVPVVGVMTAERVIGMLKEHEGNLDAIVPLSKYAPHPAEGVVYKNYAKGIFAKQVREEFKEKNAEVFGGTPKYGETPEARFTMAYCTNARIDKQIFKLVDEGHQLDLPMMAHLPKRVWKDIWSEEWEDITNGKIDAIDFKECRRLVTRRCLAVLKQVIVNNSLQKAEVQ